MWRVGAGSSIKLVKLFGENPEISRVKSMLEGGSGSGVGVICRNWYWNCHVGVLVYVAEKVIAVINLLRLVPTIDLTVWTVRL